MVNRSLITPALKKSPCPANVTAETIENTVGVSQDSDVEVSRGLVLRYLVLCTLRTPLVLP